MRMQCLFMHLSRMSYAAHDMTANGTELVEEWRDLLARHARVMSELERELQRRHGLSVTELEALSHLADKDIDGCRLQQLVDDVHISQSALSRLISRLESEGLVSRKSCADDRRGIYACITDAGLKRLAEARPTQADVLARTL